jgi:hypothetical protein
LRKTLDALQSEDILAGTLERMPSINSSGIILVVVVVVIVVVVIYMGPLTFCVISSKRGMKGLDIGSIEHIIQ